MDYLVTDEGEIAVLGNSGTPQGADFPYRRFPLYFKRQPIELDALADTPENIRRIMDRNWMALRNPARERTPLERWLGRPAPTGFDIWWHQLGGLPWLVQGPERILCPNARCAWSRRRRALKILAVIRNDPPSGLPMVETMAHVKKAKGHFDCFVQVVYHVCRHCLAIHVGNRCD
jgi:hypothetical protein